MVEGLGETFTLRRSKPLDKLTIGVGQSRLLNGVPVASVNREAAEMAYVLATLDVVKVAPREYDWNAVDDETLIVKLWADWDVWNNSFRGPQPDVAGATG